MEAKVPLDNCEDRYHNHAFIYQEWFKYVIGIRKHGIERTGQNISRRKTGVKVSLCPQGRHVITLKELQVAGK